MRKLLLAAVAAVIVGGTIGGYAASNSEATAWCPNIIVVFPSTAPGPYVPQGTVLTAGSDPQGPCNGTITGYQWKRNGTAISGATSSTYTTVAADDGAAITVLVTGTNASADSVNSAHVLGSSLLADEFNGASGTDPSSTTWAALTSSNGYVTYGGFNNMSETGTGDLQIYSTYVDQDNDGDTTSATDTDAASENADNGETDWKAGSLSSQSTFTGSRYVEARIEPDCVDNDTGWTTTYGWETSAFQVTPGNNDMELDFFGMHSKTTWQAGSGNDDADNDSDSQTGDLDNDSSSDADTDTGAENDSNPADYLAGAGAISHVTPGDADNDGDSYGVGDTDSSQVISDGDGNDTAEDTITETSDGKKSLLNHYESDTSKFCGSWHTYAALIQAHQVTYYLDGSQIFLIYTSNTYGSPNLGLTSTYDLTTVAMKQLFSLTAFQAPPQNTAQDVLYVDYVHVNALS